MTAVVVQLSVDLVRQQKNFVLTGHFGHPLELVAGVGPAGWLRRIVEDHEPRAIGIFEADGLELLAAEQPVDRHS